MTWEILSKREIYLDVYPLGSFHFFLLSKKLTVEKKKEIQQRELTRKKVDKHFFYSMDMKQDVTFN